MKNNLFYYATSELSQDAVICYCANAFNGESSELKGMAEKFIRLLLNIREVFTAGSSFPSIRDTNTASSGALRSVRNSS